MAGRLRHRIKVIEETSERGPLGPTITQTEIATLWGAFAELSLEGRAKYQQIGHSTVAGKFVFRGTLGFELKMSKHKLKFNGEYYKAIEPPGNPDTLNRFISIVVKKLPQQP